MLQGRFYSFDETAVALGIWFIVAASGAYIGAANYRYATEHYDWDHKTTSLYDIRRAAKHRRVRVLAVQTILRRHGSAKPIATKVAATMG